MSFSQYAPCAIGDKGYLKSQGGETVPAGTFDDCIVLVQELHIPGAGTQTHQSWYAKGIGLIKVFYPDGSTYSLTGDLIGGHTYGTVP